MIASTGRIWEAASTDDRRPMLRGVIFDAAKATLTATDSYIAARVPCTVEKGDESGVIPAEAIKEADGNSLRIADGKATLKLKDGERTWRLITDGTPPKIDKIMDEAQTVEIPVGFNPELLLRLSKAMTRSFVQGVGIHSVHPRKAICVTASEGEGIIMPVVLHGYRGVEAPQIPDLTNDEVVIAGVRAALAQLDRRRGKKKAAQAFREAIAAAGESR